MSANIKTFICENPNSRFKGILNDKSINGLIKVSFVFYPDSDNCLWPVNSSYFELIKDGWRQNV